jgi:hypothetical protein
LELESSSGNIARFGQRKKDVLFPMESIEEVLGSQGFDLVKGIFVGELDFDEVRGYETFDT